MENYDQFFFWRKMFPLEYDSILAGIAGLASDGGRGVPKDTVVPDGTVRKPGPTRYVASGQNEWHFDDEPIN